MRSQFAHTSFSQKVQRSILLSPRTIGRYDLKLLVNVSFSSPQLSNNRVSRAMFARGIDGVSKGGAGDMKDRYTRDRSGCRRKENRARFIKVPLVSAPPFYYMLNVDLGIRDGVRTSRGALSRYPPHAGHCYPPPPLSNVSTFSFLFPPFLSVSIFLSYPFDSCPSPKHPRMHSCCETPNE